MLTTDNGAPTKDPATPTPTPDPEVPAKAKARTFPADYKRRILEEYESLDRGQKGALLRRLRGYESATPDTIWRRFVSTAGWVTLDSEEVVVRLRSRTYSPVMRSAAIPEVRGPWWGDRRLRFEFDSSPATK